MLNRQLSEVEERSRERLREEKKKHKEVLKRVERERRIETDNFEMRIECMVQETDNIEQQIVDLQIQLDKVKEEKLEVDKKLLEAKQELEREQQVLVMLQQEREKEIEISKEERLKNNKVINQLELKIKMLKLKRSESGADSGGHIQDQEEEVVELVSRVVEMEGEIKRLMEENKCFVETQKEVEAKLQHKRFKEGHQLLCSEACQKTLADELGEMSENELRKSLVAQQSANLHLRCYIDTVLISIMERHPQMLEITK
eukprot:GFUD01084849.1.p1 GENE.GFUD01084849.1~~GFUD01084849.1.p1  ORF type:complete len:258 (+),score=113.32 GFUD01084849.1:51-824(+)